MRTTDTNSVTVSGAGTANATFTKAKFSIRVRKIGRSGPEAKQNARPVIDQIKAVIQAQAKEAGIDVTRLQTDFAVALNQRYNNATGQHESSGYTATYTCAFSATAVDKATKLHDALTSIDGAEAESPQFCIDKSAEIEDAAFKAAMDDAKRRFAAQCRAAGLDPNGFELATWSLGSDPGYRGGKMMAMAAALSDEAGGGAVELEPGKAEQTTTVSVTFVRKAQGSRKLPLQKGKNGATASAP